MKPLSFALCCGYLGIFHLVTGISYLLFNMQPMTALETVAAGIFMLLCAGVLALCKAGYQWYRQRRHAHHACL